MNVHTHHGNHRHNHSESHSLNRRSLSVETTSATVSEQDDEGLDETCPCFHEATRPYSQDFFEELKLWPGLMNNLDEENGETLYGSRWALEEIHKNQNPENCSEAKYLVTGGWPYGFGSRVHVEGIGLAIAMHLGRVYLPHPDGDNLFWETKVPFCQNIRHDTTLNCFYERYSKCTIHDAVKASKFARDVNSFRTYYATDFQNSFLHEDDLHRMKEQLDSHVAINVVFTTGKGNMDTRTYIPHQMHQIIQCSPMLNLDIQHYWWRAISATYIIRPNREHLIPYLESLTDDTNHLNGKDLFRTKETYRDCIAMFVRHGDKGIEMKLLEFSEYRDVAQSMWNGGLVPGSIPLVAAAVKNMSPSEREGHGAIAIRGRERDKKKRRLNGVATGDVHPAYLSNINNQHFHNWTHITRLPNTFLTKNGTMFITTEDPAVLEQAETWGKENHWTIAYTNLFDRAKQTAYKTWDEQHKRGSVAVHDNLEYISMILNLQYALQCEAWVCTIASNSCRVIDELRTTVGGKANRHYADLSGETCSDPPCILGHGKIVKVNE